LLQGIRRLNLRLPKPEAFLRRGDAPLRPVQMEW
jgi:hypothetical protein